MARTRGFGNSTGRLVGTRPDGVVTCVCKDCNVEHPWEDMHFRRKKGTVFRTHNCVDCYRRQARIRYGRVVVIKRGLEFDDAMGYLDGQI
jgi:hypothetical protein